MKPDMILQSDMLDILFEGKNKDYGAYTLRKAYNSRLMKAMAATLLLVLLFIGGYYWAGSMKEEPVFVPFADKPDVQLKIFEMEKPAAPKPLAALPRKVATIKVTPPVIVPDNQKADPPPPIDELVKESAAISTATTAGGPPTETASPPPAAETGGTGPAPAAPPVEAERVLPVAEKMPEFPGGQEALRRFLGRHLRVPEDLMEVGQRVKVPVRFIVSKDGQVSGVEFMAQADEAFRKEILRVVNKMPRWIAGSQGGKTVAVYCMIPIIFEVPEE
jgi:protein TonB